MGPLAELDLAEAGLHFADQIHDRERPRLVEARDASVARAAAQRLARAAQAGPAASA